MPKSKFLSSLDAAKLAVEEAKLAGASGSLVSVRESRSFSGEMRNGVVEKMQESTESSLNVDLFVSGRFSSHSTNDLTPDALKRFVVDAVGLTKLLQPDEFRTLPDASRFAKKNPDLEIYDPQVAKVNAEQRLAAMRAINAQAHNQPKVISANSSVWDGGSKKTLVTSNGFEGEYRSSSIGYDGFVTLQGEGDKRPANGFGMGARTRAHLWTPERIGQVALGRAQAMLGTKKGPTKRTTMVVERWSARSLISRLLGPASGSAVQQKRSMWADKLGKKVISPRLTLRHEPLLRGGVRSRPFDAEGYASASMPVFEEGALRTFFIDTYYANKLGVKPTTSDWSNLVVSPGKRDETAIVGSVKDGIFVTSWLGGNSDGTTGDFSFGARGHLIRRGKIAGPVGEMNVTGNLIDLFANLEEVGSDVWEHSSIRTPTLVFGGVQFSGA